MLIRFGTWKIGGCWFAAAWIAGKLWAELSVQRGRAIR